MQEPNGKYSISFEELSRRQKEILDKQGPVTFEQAKAQVERLKKGSYLRSMTEKDLKEGLDERFTKRSGGDYIVWDVHGYTYYGMGYGLEVIWRMGKGFALRQMVDSGYNAGRIISTDVDQIYHIIYCLCPTLKDFKFDRK